MSLSHHQLLFYGLESAHCPLALRGWVWWALCNISIIAQCVFFLYFKAKEIGLALGGGVEREENNMR